MQVDVILQGKGGVGKSFVASLLAQHYGERGQPPVCIDTDPVNATFAAYKSYGVERLTIMEGEDINPRSFDQLVERIMSHGDEGIMVVDNGAATFVPLCSYLASNEVLPFLHEQGHEIRLHTVLTGGQALEDTFNGLSALAVNFPETPIIVWFNEFFGPLERNGHSLEKSAAYKALTGRIYAEIRLPEVKKETFGHDLERMLSARQTFDEAIAAPDNPVMTKQRLRMIWRNLSVQMEQARL